MKTPWLIIGTVIGGLVGIYFAIVLLFVVQSRWIGSGLATVLGAASAGLIIGVIVDAQKRQTKTNGDSLEAEDYFARCTGATLILKCVTLLMFGTISGSVLGAVTNWFNGYVSPKYFEQVMGWYSYATGISAAAIREGILEGAVNGASLSIIFIALIAAMSHGHFRLLVAIKYALFAFSAAIALWFIGGGLAVLYVLLSSNPSTRWFGNHGSADTVLPYAWVRGSIMAIVFGGPFAVTTSLVCYALRHCAPVARYRN